MILAVPTSETAERRWAWRTTAGLLILAAALLRLLYLARACPLDLAPDEAHYWDWSRHLDWCYYSKGPLVALLIRASCELFGPLAVAWTGNEMLAVRLPAVICGSLLLVALYVLTVQVHRRERWALAAVGLALTLPLIAAGSTLMTIDAPFTCAWAWALVFAHRAVFRGSWWAWLATGLCVLTGVLAKHTMVLWVPMFALFLLMTPEVRAWLWSGRFWVMTAIGALAGVPMIFWNIQHGWVTLLHERGHAGMDDGLSLLGPLRYLGLQAAVLLGFWFVAWVRAAWAQHPGREGRPELRYLWWMSVPLVAFFLLFSVRNGGGEANWPVAGYIAGMVLVVGWLAHDLAAARPLYRRVAWAGMGLTGALGIVLTILVHEPGLIQPMLVPFVGEPTAQNPMPLRRFDPTGRLRGWHVLAREVDRLRQELGGDVVIAADSWSMPGELGFYCAGHPQVYSLGLVFGDRHSQYDLWHPNPLDDPYAFAGKTFLVIGPDAARLRAKDGFERVRDAGVVVYREHGQPLAMWSITVAEGYRGFPRPAHADH